MITLHDAQINELPIIAELAHKIWHLHYTPIIGEKQVLFMLNKMYNLESLTDQLENKKHRFFLVKLNHEFIGFISISSDNTRDFWIHKFYLLQNNQRQGLGTTVFNQIKHNMNEPATIRLTVNRQNFKSINFYFKIGFRIEQVADFDIGEGFYMNDFVMLWLPKTAF